MKLKCFTIKAVRKELLNETVISELIMVAMLVQNVFQDTDTLFNLGFLFWSQLDKKP